MMNKATQSQTDGQLSKGQIWKTGAADIEVLGVGNGFVHYKVTTRVGRRRVSAQVSGLEPMANYLRYNRARLVQRRTTSLNSARFSTIASRARCGTTERCFTIAE